MKKVLFGIMALSAVSFAANPGSATEASVPVEVKAQVLAANNALVITDEAGNLLGDGIILDHGIRAQGDTDHIVSKIFKVKRVNGTGTAPNQNAIGQTGKTTLTVTLEDTDGGQQTVNLGRTGGGVAPNDKIVSTLTLPSGVASVTGSKYGYKADMGTTATEHTSSISSKINVALNQNPGSYTSRIDPTGDNKTATLKVVLEAGGAPIL
ncbi:MAG: hypothetical protein ACRCZO_06770 [Cetobacterium sp.]